MLASYLLSRTLVPTLVTWFYRDVKLHGEHIDESRVPFWLLPFIRFQRFFENGFDRFRNGYRALLASCFEHRRHFVIYFLAFCIGSLLLLATLGQNFFRTWTPGNFCCTCAPPPARASRKPSGSPARSTASSTAKFPADELGGILDNIGIPNSSINLSYNTSGIIGANDADMLVSLKPGHAPTADYVRRLRARLNREFPGTMFYFLPADIVSQTLNFGLPAPFDVQIVGRDQVKNRELAVRLAEQIKKIPGAVDVRVQQPNNLPQFSISVDRTKAAEFGLTEQNVAKSVLLGLSGSSQVQPAYWLNPDAGVQYLINVSAPQYAMDSVQQLNALPVSGGLTGVGGDANSCQRGQPQAGRGAAGGFALQHHAGY